MTTYTIPTWRMAEFEERIAKLAKKAKKLGVDPVGFEVVGEKYVPVQEPATDEDGNLRIDPWAGIPVDQRPESAKIKCAIVTVYGGQPKMAGWSFVGTIEHTDAGNIMRAVPGEQIPAGYRTRRSECDHCKVYRQRKDTYVVRHESGQDAQVGSTCIADFLGGKSAEAIAAMCEALAHFNQEIEEDFAGEGAFARAPAEYSIHQILAITCAVTRKVGRYWSRAAVEEAADWSINTTGSDVSGYLFARGDTRRKLDAWLGGITEADNNQALEIINWVKNGGLKGDSDYVYNLNTLFATGFVNNRSIGIAASAWAAYEREVMAAKRDAQLANSDFFGTVGKREVFELTVFKVRGNQTDFGWSTIINFLDEKGNLAVWFASGDKIQDFREGTKVKVKATVKKHDTFRGVKQTIINRVTPV